jgi:hypothetical protein
VGAITPPVNWPCVECAEVCRTEAGYVEHLRESHRAKFERLVAMGYEMYADRPGAASRQYAPKGGWPDLKRRS